MRIATTELGKSEAMNARKNCCDWRSPGRPSAAVALCALALAFCGPGPAAGEGRENSPSASIVDFSGIPCTAGAAFRQPLAATAEELPWRSVWLGHFSGGRPYKDPYFGLTFIDWLDLKVCFPERRACEAWVRDLRGAYHRPEGYWTCLLLR